MLLFYLQSKVRGLFGFRSKGKLEPLTGKTSNTCTLNYLIQTQYPLYVTIYNTHYLLYGETVLQLDIILVQCFIYAICLY